MHAGEGKAAVLLADEAIERFVAIHANAGEAYIVKAMGLVQSGSFDDARVALGHVAEELLVHPFYLAALAIVAALESDGDEAIASAEAVAEAPGHTYLDGVIASVGAGASAAATGDAEAAQRWLDIAVAQALATEDVVATALALAAFEHVLGWPHLAGGGRLDGLAVGWRCVVEALPRLVNVS
jgi:hypothetical protein